jgi:hypothetical protein
MNDRLTFSQASSLIPKHDLNARLQIPSKLNVFARHDADTSLEFVTTYVFWSVISGCGEYAYI